MRDLIDVVFVLVSVLVMLQSAHTLYLTLYTWDRPPEVGQESGGVATAKISVGAAP